MKPNPELACPHCQHEITPEEFRLLLGQYSRAHIRRKTGPKPQLTPCPHCRRKMGVRALLEHRGKCPKNPRNLSS